MAFSETDIGKICRILRINRLEYNGVAVYFSHYITAEVISQVGDLISEWFTNGVGSQTTSVDPNTANAGARFDPEIRRDQIRRELRTLLIIPDDVGSGGGGTGFDDSFEIVRG